MEQISKLVWNQSLPEELLDLVRALEDEYPISDSGRGLKLSFKRVEGEGIISNVIRSKGAVTVEYNTVSGAARGIGSAFSRLDGKESTPFKKLGIMLDVSRNMVMKVEHLKVWMRRLALCGYNQLMLYTEDTYELEEYPKFGFQRGAYLLEEIQELDAYAAKLGIELVGCIQTLGHLEQMLKYNEFSSVRDTGRVLMVDAPETEKLIESMISFWSKALSSRRIHIGMDETHDLGRGRYMDHNGFVRGFDLFNRQLAMVNKVCGKYGLTPMIWSDMYFRLSNPDQKYYDLESPIPQDVQKAIPGNVQLVYWDYYHEEKEKYTGMIRRHRDIGYEPIMGSGIWTWAKMWYDHDQTRRTAEPCLAACRDEKVQEVFFTMWGDDGAYCNYDSSLAGIFYAGDLSFGINSFERTEARFNTLCAPTSFEAHIAASELDYRLTDSRGDTFVVSASMLLWDDPLLGTVCENYSRREPEFDLIMLDHYEELLCRVLPEFDADGAGDLELASDIASALIKKLELYGALRTAYKEGDIVALREIAVKLIPATIAAVTEFDSEFRAQWHAVAKPFGLERIQHRNAGLIARLEETALRINEYISGAIERIDELEEQLPKNAAFEHINRYHRASSGSVII